MHRTFLLLALTFFACSTKDKTPDALEAYLTQTFAHVARIEDFFIAAGDRKPKETDRPSATGKEVFDTAVRLFESLLDQDEDGVVDRPPLVAALAKYLVFVIDYTDVTDKEEEKIQSQYGNYVMTMKSDIWPYMPSFNTGNCDLTLTKLNTSMWRPETYNALWEECFHTVTEAQNRIDPSFSFEPGSVLGAYMQADISAGTYNISEQNNMEGGNYDFITAVNEYMHQIWLINACGGSEILNVHQRAVLTLMGTVEVPLTINLDYALDLAEMVK